MKKLTALIITLLFVFSSCGPKKNSLVRVEREKLADMAGKKIAYIVRRAEPVEAFTYEEYGGAMAAAYLAGMAGASIAMADLIGKSKTRIKAVYGPEAYPSQVLRNQLTEYFIQKYQMVEQKIEREINNNDSHQIALQKADNVDYVVDVKPVDWAIRWMEADTEKYYFTYQADLNFLENVKRGKVIGTMRCSYRSTEEFKPKYTALKGKRVLIPEQQLLVDQLPGYRDWFQNKGAMIKEHSEKAVELCINQFFTEVIGE